MKYTITIELEVQDGAGFLSTQPAYYQDDVASVITDSLYDIDDIVVMDISVTQQS